MREALGQPLQNISKELLNKVVSKEVARDLRKYKYTVAGGNTGKTPSKENRRLNGQLSAEKGGSPAAAKRLNFGSPAPNDRANTSNAVDVKDLLKELNAGVHEKVSMLKMLAVKCGEAETSYKKIRTCLLKGDATQAERVVSMLEQMNSVTLKDLQSELSTSNDIFEVIAEISDTIQREKREQSKSVGKDRTLQENNILKR
jgi:hypothetical protein